jgi:hypothetical protein
MEKRKGPDEGALFKFFLPVGRADYLIGPKTNSVSLSRQHVKPLQRSSVFAQFSAVNAAE